MAASSAERTPLLLGLQKSPVPQTANSRLPELEVEDLLKSHNEWAKGHRAAISKIMDNIPPLDPPMTLMERMQKLVGGCCSPLLCRLTVLIVVGFALLIAAVVVLGLFRPSM